MPPWIDRVAGLYERDVDTHCQAAQIFSTPPDGQPAWGVEVPDIPGCFSAGDDLDDALAMAREAIEGHLEILAEDGAAIPVAKSVTIHASNPEFAGCTWAVVDIDVISYMGKAEN